jgi:GH43 family beta-xylosidase
MFDVDKEKKSVNSEWWRRECVKEWKVALKEMEEEENSTGGWSKSPEANKWTKSKGKENSGQSSQHQGPCGESVTGVTGDKLEDSLVGHHENFGFYSGDPLESHD